MAIAWYHARNAHMFEMKLKLANGANNGPLIVADFRQ